MESRFLIYFLEAGEFKLCISTKMILKKGHRENVVPAFKRLNIIIIDACTDHEIAGSILGTSTNFKCALGLERGPPNLVWTIG